MKDNFKSANAKIAPIFLGFFLLPLISFAANIDVSPKVVDVKGRAREISHYGITIKNNTQALLSTFVWAVDVDQAKGDLSKVDMSGINSNSVTSSPSKWIEISRSIQVLPKEEQTVPLQIQIPSQVKPGIYHVSLKFSTGETQNAAMACNECISDVSVNIEVTEDVREKLQLYSFSSVKNIFIKPKADFQFSVENTGNRTVVPNGKIRIFDNSGKEVGLIDVNVEGKQIEPKAKDLLAASWAAKGKFGKYKALLDVSYGQRGTMQDVVYFWIIPWARLFSFAVTILAVMIITVLFIRSRALARPEYVYNNEYEDDEVDDEPIVNNTELVSRIGQKNTNNKAVKLSSDFRAKSLGLTEVNIPSRTRTVPPSMSVQLSEKNKVRSEEHVVRLK